MNAILASTFLYYWNDFNFACKAIECVYVSFFFVLFASTEAGNLWLFNCCDCL